MGIFFSICFWLLNGIEEDLNTIVPELDKYKYKLDDQTLKHDNCDIIIKHKGLDE